MKKILRRLAGVVAAISLGTWLMCGANRGWTKTSETRWVRDPVTEIDGPVIVPRFMPGIDFLGAGVAGAAVLIGLSFLWFRERR